MSVVPLAGARRDGLLSQALLQAALLVAGVLFFLPFAWMLATSLKSLPETLEVTPSLLPREAHWDNYSQVMQRAPFLRFYLNSVVVTLGRVVGQLLVCSMAAFAFARLRFPGREALFILLLSALMVPEPMTYIPNFVLLRQFGWLDSYQGLIVPSLFSAFGTFLLRQFFLTVPYELQEAATLEGANPFQVYRHIFLPMARPALAAFGLLVAVWSWNDFLWPLIVASRSDMYVLSVGIALFQGVTASRAETTLMMAAATMATAPMLALFLVAQRQLIEGISLSGLKG